MMIDHFYIIYIFTLFKKNFFIFNNLNKIIAVVNDPIVRSVKG